ARSLFEQTKLQQSNRLALDEEADLFTILPEDIIQIFSVLEPEELSIYADLVKKVGLHAEEWNKSQS
ncbi:hypothetical protein, partial [Jeotgalibaca porci]|uniref:hypothetical protein n=1 Tax=Jeotgalibaca porci TaxID=1868793 RepID=UPI0035A1703F